MNQHYCKTVKWEEMPKWTLDDMFNEFAWVSHLRALAIENMIKHKNKQEMFSKDHLEWKGLNEDAKFLKNAIEERILKENANAKL